MNPKPEFEIKIVRMAEAIQECILNQKVDPEKDFPTLIEIGLGAEVVECWEALYGDKFRQAKESLRNSKEFVFEFPKVKGFPRGRITMVPYQDRMTAQPNIELSVTRGQLLDISRTLNVAYSQSAGYAEYILDDGRKVIVKIVE